MKWLWGTMKFLWDNRDFVQSSSRRLYDTFFPTPGILIVGPGGAGKTTLGDFLVGEFDHLLNIPGEYVESLDVESKSLNRKLKKIEIKVAPGQDMRQQSVWGPLLEDLQKGKFQGVFVVACYGYLSTTTSIDRHSAFRKGDTDTEFLNRYLETQRKSEIDVLRKISGPIKDNYKPLWLLTFVGKEDLAPAA